MIKEPFFDAVLLIDCWNENWLKEQGCFGAREAYGRMCDFLSYSDVRLALYSCGHKSQDIHPMFREIFPELHRVETLVPFKKFVKTGGKVLVAGQAFGMCFHYNTLGCVNLIGEGYRVYSSPKLINTDYEKDTLGRKKSFKKDKVITWTKLGSSIYRGHSKINRKHMYPESQLI